MRERETDESLVERAAEAPEGDMRAFDQLVGRYQEKVVTNCRYITRRPDDAQDLAQEVFVKAYFALPRFEMRASFKTWIQRIKVNHCLNDIKKRKDALTVSFDEPGMEQRTEVHVAAQAERNVAATDDRRRIDAVLNEMSDTLRVPLLLRDMDGFSYQEIADMLGVKLSAVKMRIKRAREEFRSLYETTPTAPRKSRERPRASADLGAS